MPNKPPLSNDRENEYDLQISTHHQEAIVVIQDVIRSIINIEGYNFSLGLNLVKMIKKFERMNFLFYKDGNEEELLFFNKVSAAISDFINEIEPEILQYQDSFKKASFIISKMSLLYQSDYNFKQSDQWKSIQTYLGKIGKLLNSAFEGVKILFGVISTLPTAAGLSYIISSPLKSILELLENLMITLKTGYEDSRKLLLKFSEL